MKNKNQVRMPSSLSRRQTCPITRKESEQLLDFFLNIPTSPRENVKPIITTESNNNEKPAEIEVSEKIDEISSEAPERPVFNRTDSYRKATQKFSFAEVVETTMTFKKENYDRQKYSSLPIDVKSKLKHDKKDKQKSTVAKKNKLNRQKSGTVPSSDSDGPAHHAENRQKKSVFKRTKERFIFKFWKDRANHDNEKKIATTKKDSVPERTAILGERKDVLEIDSCRVQVNTTSIEAEGNEPRNISTKSAPKEGSQNIPSPTMAPNSTKSPNHGRRSYRSQVSREEITSIFEKILSSSEVKDEPFKFPSSPQNRKCKRNDFSPVQDISYADGIKNKKATLHLDIVPFTPATRTETQVTVVQETIRTSIEREGTFHTVLSERCSIERSLSLEVDGLDDVDGPTSPNHDKPLDETGKDEPLSPDEQERMIEEIARRLNRIADDCVQRMSNEQHDQPPCRGAVAEPLLSPRSRSRKLANDLVIELRKEGDRLSQELDLPESLLPIVMDMVRQISYDHFKKLIKQALYDTIGWDQVAMYLYVSRAAIVMAGVGGKVAGKLKDMVVKYFYEEISPWIFSKGGLETMLEETDSEVD